MATLRKRDDGHARHLAVHIRAAECHGKGRVLQAVDAGRLRDRSIVHRRQVDARGAVAGDPAILAHAIGQLADRRAAVDFRRRQVAQTSQRGGAQRGTRHDQRVVGRPDLADSRHLGDQHHRAFRRGEAQCHRGAFLYRSDGAARRDRRGRRRFLRCGGGG